MSSRRNVAVCFLLFILYFAAGSVAHGLFMDAVLATMVVDIFIGVIALVAYHACIGDACLPVKPYAGSLISIGLIGFYFTASLTGTYIQNAFIDVSGGLTNQSTGNWVVLLALIIAPVFEEVMFRGWMFRVVKSRAPTWVAYILTGLAFGLWHMSLPHLYIGFLFSIFLCVVYSYTGKLAASVMTHMAYNLLAFLTAGVALPDVLFSVPVLAGLNIILISLLAYGAVYIENGLSARQGYQKPEANKKPFWAGLSRPRSGLVDILVRNMVDIVTENTCVLIMDQTNTQLYFGGAGDLKTSNSLLLNRKVQAGGSFCASLDEAMHTGYLIIKIL